MRFGARVPGHQRSRYRDDMPARVGLFVLAAVLVASGSSSAGTASGLRGKVALYPARPVCTEDEPCTKPAVDAVLVFKHDGRVVARVTTRDDATYRVLLSPGRYAVVAPRYRVGSGVTPSVVRVLEGRIRRVDLQIDTGIQ